MAFKPAFSHASSPDGGTNPARVKPQSLMRLSTAGSFGGLFHGMMGKKFVAARRQPELKTVARHRPTAKKARVAFICAVVCGNDRSFTMDWPSSPSPPPGGEGRPAHHSHSGDGGPAHHSRSGDGGGE